MSLNGTTTTRNVTNSSTITSTTLKTKDVLANTINEYTTGNGINLLTSTAVTGNLAVSGTITGSVSGTVTTTSMNCSDCTITGGFIESVSITKSSASLNGLDMNNHVISNVLTPVSSNDAVNKSYVDNIASGLYIKSPVKVATTSALPNAEALGTDILKGSIDGFIGNIDGVEVSANDRILVKDQADQTQNGIYTFTRVGNESENWLMVRSTDADNTPSNEVAGGLFVFVQQGTTNGDTGYVLTAPNGNATLGTHNLVFSQFSAFTYTADNNGLTVTNKQFALSYGNTANTVCVGNDSRLSDSRQCNNNFDNASTARTNIGLGTTSTPTFTDLTLSKAGSGVTNLITINAGLSGDPSTSNISKVRLQTQAGGGGTVTTDIQNYYDGANYVLSVTDGTTENFKIKNSDGAIYARGLSTSGYVKSSSGTLSTVATIANTDITGLGTMSTATATDYLAKADNLSGLTNTTTARSNLGLGSMALATATDYLTKADNLSGLANTTTSRSNLGLGSIATLNIPSSGYVTSNGSTLSAVSSIPLVIYLLHQV